MDIFDGIAILAFLMTAITWLYGWYSLRVDVDLRVARYRKLENFKHLYYIIIENNSARPVTVSQITLFDVKENIFINCGIMPEEAYAVKESKGNEVIKRTPYMTLGLPVVVPAHGGIGGYVQFPDSEQTISNLSTLSCFQVRVNRNRIFEYSIKPDESYYGQQKLQ